MSFLADTPKPPYYAVVFPSIKREYDEEYEQTAAASRFPAGTAWRRLKGGKTILTTGRQNKKEKAPGMKRTRSA